MSTQELKLKLASHLWQSDFGVYYIRVKRNGRDFKKSLGTKDPNIARKIAYQFGSGQMDIRKLIVDFDDKGKIKRIETDGSEQDNAAAVELVKTIASSHTVTPHAPPATISDALMFNNVQHVKLDKAIAEYFEYRKTDFSHSTRLAYNTAFNKLKIAFKNAFVHQVNQTDFVKFRQSLDTTLHPKSVKSHCVAWSHFFEYCIQNRYTTVNPIIQSKASQTVNKARKEAFKRDRNPFEKDDLQKIFDARRYANITKPCAFWLPILALYSGARISDLCELRLDDICLNNNIFEMKIGSKKTASSRIIPIHDDLIKVGLLKYLVDVKELKLNDDKLFPHLRPAAKNGLANLPGRDFSALKISLGLGDDKVFHSFRSTLISTLQFNGCDAQFRKLYVGHDDGLKKDVHTSHYSKATFTPARLAELIFPYLDFKLPLDWELDIDAIKYTEKRFDGYLRKMNRKNTG